MSEILYWLTRSEMQAVLAHSYELTSETSRNRLLGSPFSTGHEILPNHDLLEKRDYVKVSRLVYRYESR
jgi:hypothetical protein